MDWEGIQTAILDRERARLGLPSRMEVEAARAKQAQAAAESASGLETAGLQREKLRGDIEMQPELTRLRSEAALAQAEAARTRAGQQPQLAGDAYLSSLDPTQLAEHVRRKRMVAEATRGPEGQQIDRAAWQPQYDAGGNLLGFVHLGQFHSKEAMGVPAGARRPLAASTVSELSLLDNPARLPDIFRQSLAETRAAEGESPIAAGTGVVMGNVGNVYRRFDTSGPGGDFDAARKQVRQVVYGLSGKQLNQSELQWLDSITPNLADPGVDEQINRFDSFVTALVEAKRQGISDPFSAARLGFGIQRGPGAEAAAPAGVKVQRNRTTGEVRHSLDGGATWQPGPPPQ